MTILLLLQRSEEMDLPEYGVLIQHKYTAPNTYNVTVTAENINGTKTLQRNICIRKKVYFDM